MFLYIPRIAIVCFIVVVAKRDVGQQKMQQRDSQQMTDQMSPGTFAELRNSGASVFGIFAAEPEYEKNINLFPTSNTWDGVNSARMYFQIGWDKTVLYDLHSFVNEQQRMSGDPVTSSAELSFSLFAMLKETWFQTLNFLVTSGTDFVEETSYPGKYFSADLDESNHVPLLYRRHFSWSWRSLFFANANTGRTEFNTKDENDNLLKSFETEVTAEQKRVNAIKAPTNAELTCKLTDLTSKPHMTEQLLSSWKEIAKPYSDHIQEMIELAAEYNEAKVPLKKAIDHKTKWDEMLKAYGDAQGDAKAGAREKLLEHVRKIVFEQYPACTASLKQHLESAETDTADVSDLNAMTGKITTFMGSEIKEMKLMQTLGEPETKTLRDSPTVLGTSLDNFDRLALVIADCDQVTKAPYEYKAPAVTPMPSTVMTAVKTWHEELNTLFSNRATSITSLQPLFKSFATHADLITLWGDDNEQLAPKSEVKRNAVSSDDVKNVLQAWQAYVKAVSRLIVPQSDIEQLKADILAHTKSLSTHEKYWNFLRPTDALYTQQTSAKHTLAIKLGILRMKLVQVESELPLLKTHVADIVATLPDESVTDVWSSNRPADGVFDDDAWAYITVFKQHFQTSLAAAQELMREMVQTLAFDMFSVLNVEHDYAMLADQAVHITRNNADSAYVSRGTWLTSVDMAHSLLDSLQQSVTKALEAQKTSISALIEQRVESKVQARMKSATKHDQVDKSEASKLDQQHMVNASSTKEEHVSQEAIHTDRAEVSDAVLVNNLKSTTNDSPAPAPPTPGAPAVTGDTNDEPPATDDKPSCSSQASVSLFLVVAGTLMTVSD